MIDQGRWVVLDVGMTLLDESRVWRTWADELGISQMEFMSVFGALVARGDPREDLRDLSLFPAVRHDPIAPRSARQWNPVFPCPVGHAVPVEEGGHERRRR